MLENILERFQELDVGTKLIRVLDVTEGDLRSPMNESKLIELAEFLNEHPDPHFILEMTKYNKSPHMNNLDFLVGYTQLNKKKVQLSKELDKVDKDIKFYEGI